MNSKSNSRKKHWRKFGRKDWGETSGKQEKGEYEKPLSPEQEAGLSKGRGDIQRDCNPTTWRDLEYWGKFTS